MRKQRSCEDRLGRTGKAEVQSVGWGSSLLNDANNSPPRQGNSDFLRGWEAQTPGSWEGVSGEQQLRERIAQTMARNNRRHHPRLAQPAEIRIQQLSNPLMAAEMISAEVQNLGRGGICVTSPLPLATSSVVRCQIGMPDLRFAIPSMMQVVWLERTGESAYSIGLSYLL